MIVRFIIRVDQTAVIYHAFKILCYCYYQEEGIKLISDILSARLELKSFALLLCLLLVVRHSINELICILSEKGFAPHTTTIVDCADCRESRINSYIDSYRQKGATGLAKKGI